MATFTKAERKLIDRYKAMHRFRVAHTEEEYKDPESMSEDRMKELSSKMLRFIFDSEPC